MSRLRFRAAIVDLDGTMVDTLGDFEVALNRTLADLALPPVDKTLVERTVGKGSEHLIRSVLVHQLASPEQVHSDSPCAKYSLEQLQAMAWERYQHHYRDINGTCSTVYPGVLEGLRQLQQAGCALACLTNKPLAFARELLAAKALDGHFGQVYGGDSFERKKPDPLPLLKTCEALGVSPGETLMVGDSSNDALAAAAAGCEVVLVTYGYNHGQPIRQTPALAWVDSLVELGPICGL